MNVKQLNPAQLEELAQNHLTEHYSEYNPEAAELEGPSYGELAAALQIVTRETLESEYADTEFTRDDFFSSARTPERYEVREIDAWAEYDNPDDPDEAPSWIWNTSYLVGTFTTAAQDTARAFRHYLKTQGVTFRRGTTRTEFDGSVFEIVDRETGAPLYAAIPMGA